MKFTFQETPQENDAFQYGGDIAPRTEDMPKIIKIAADNIEALRASDVYRVLDEAGAGERRDVLYIGANGANGTYDPPLDV